MCARCRTITRSPPEPDIVQTRTRSAGCGRNYNVDRLRVRRSGAPAQLSRRWLAVPDATGLAFVSV